MTSTLGSELTRDAFLGGKVLALQPRGGFRAGIDSVLVAAACPARKGDTVLELGTGAGVAALCVMARVPGASVLGLEIQDDYVQLARENGVEVVLGDIIAPPDCIRTRQFDHVFFNPPYFETGKGAAAPDAGRQTARALNGALGNWFATAEKRLKPKGTLTVIQRTSRLPDMLAALGPTLGSVEILPLAPRKGREAKLTLLRARKDGRAPFRLHAPLILHHSAKHDGDHPDYTLEVAGILQNGDALHFPD